MNKELWQRAEDVAHDLRMLHTLIALVRRYSRRVPPYPISGELLDIITTLDAIADCARTLSSEQRDKFRGAAFDIEIPFALAREARREFTSEERHRVQETIKNLLTELENLISRLEKEETFLWERIGKDTGL